MSFEIEKGENGNLRLVIEFDPESGRPSKSRKSTVLDTSAGFTYQDIDGHQIGVNYNVIKPK